MKKPLVLCDIDGVIRDFMGGIALAVSATYPGTRILRENETRWDCLKDVYPDIPDIERQVFDGRLTMDCYYNLADAYPGTVEEIMLMAGRFDLMFCTSQPNYRTRKYTLQWLNKMGLGDLPVVFCRDKSLIQCDALIDDGPHNLAQVHRAGSAKLLIRMAQPWNKGAAGLAVNNLMEARHMIEKMAWNTESK